MTTVRDHTDRELGRPIGFTFRQRRAQLVAMGSARQLTPPAEYVAALEASIAALPLEPGEQTVLRMGLGLEEPEGSLVEPLARDRAVGRIFKKLNRVARQAPRPAIEQFRALFHEGYGKALAQALATTVLPELLQGLRARYDAGDATALGEALLAVDPEGAVKDPATIPAEWIRRGVLAAARQSLPLVGRGRRPELTPEERRARKRRASARSKAVKRLENEYDRLKGTLGPTEAAEQVTACYRSRSRLTGPEDVTLTLRAFQQRIRTR